LPRHGPAVSALKLAWGRTAQRVATILRKHVPDVMRAASVKGIDRGWLFEGVVSGSCRTGFVSKMGFWGVFGKSFLPIRWGADGGDLFWVAMRRQAIG